MKCSITRSDLLKMIELCRAATDAKNEHVAVQCIHLSAQDNVLRAFSTNLILDIRSEAQCAVELPGACALNAEKLRAAIRAMPDGLVTIKSDPKKFATTLTCAGAQRRYQITGINPEHMPERQEPPGDLQRYTLNSKLFKEAVSRVKGSMALPSAGRMHMSSVLLEFTEKSLVSVATNSMTLSHFEHKDDFQHPTGSVVITADALPSILNLGDGDISISYNNTKCFVSSGNHRIAYKLPEAPFPHWRAITQMAPFDQIQCGFDVEQLINAVRGVTAVAKGDLQVSLGNSTLNLSLLKAPDAESEDSMPVKGEPEAAFSCVVNPDYFMQVLEGAGGGIGKFSYNARDTNSVLVLLGDDGFYGIVQPLQR